MTDANQPPSPKLSKPLHGGIIFLLGIIAVTAGVLASRGNGVPPAYYAIATFALVCPGIVIVGRLARQRKKLVQLIALVMVGIGAFGLAHFTCFRPPAQLFNSCLGLPVPAGVDDLTGRVQWYDGQVYVLEFRCSDDAFDKILSAKKYQPVLEGFAPASAEYLASWWKRNIALWRSVAWMDRTELPAMQKPMAYEEEKASSASDVQATSIIRDASTGHTWVIGLR